jgi:hypothetical protein
MRRRVARRLALVLAILAAAVAAAWLALDPLVTWRTRKILHGMKGMRGTFADVEVSPLALAYTIDGLRLDKVGPDGRRVPYLSIERARFGLDWRELLRGHVVAKVDLLAPELTLVASQSESERRGAEETPEAGWGIERLAPFRLDRVQAREGVIRWVDAREPERPRLSLHGVEATLENFATRKALAKDEPTVLAVRGTLQRTGKVSVFATADPLAKQLTFAGQGRIEGLAVTDLGELVAAKTGLKPEAGTLDLSVRFRAVAGNLSGGVRPVLSNASTKPAHPGLGPALKSLVADAALEIFGDDVPGRDAVATTIPIQGTVDDPKAQPVPTILGVLRNAFVRGLTDGLGGLPPPTAKKKESVPEQARRALSPSRGPPRAQPTRSR